MIKVVNTRTAEEKTLTLKQYERFFHNRDPREWAETREEV